MPKMFSAGAFEEYLVRSDDENSAQSENGVAVEGNGAGSAEGSLKRKAGVQNSVSDTAEGGESVHPAKRTVTDPTNDPQPGTPAASLSGLPIELKSPICWYIGTRDVVHLSATNSEWRNIMSPDYFWRLLFQHHFPDRYTKDLPKRTNNWRERYKSEIHSRCRWCMRAHLITAREGRLQLCNQCETLSKPEYDLISATQAKKRYLLNDWYLERLGWRCLEMPFRKGGIMMRLFVKKDLERAAMKRYGGEKGFEAAGKRQEERWERSEREDKLRAAVKAKGLPFRGPITLDSVVSDIAELHVLQDHTKYLQYLELSSAAKRRFLDIETAARERSLVLLAEVEKSYKALPREQKTAGHVHAGDCGWQIGLMLSGLRSLWQSGVDMLGWNVHSAMGMDDDRAA
ncbi:hypothetical protein HK104_011440 [Borealophlyctis nickersoniae]|nr:hypothetical protein HK104_011440 [Borealophlyctis nickersoniae]